MFFGATSFSAAPFAGVGIVNITVEATGNRLNLSIGNTSVGLVTTVPVTGRGFTLATDTINVITWTRIPPGASQIWIPIDPDNP